jgi:hypothetical protein
VFIQVILRAVHKTPLILDTVLKMNLKTERFTNNRKANQLPTREYRKPFAVPEKVQPERCRERKRTRVETSCNKCWPVEGKATPPV